MSTQKQQRGPSWLEDYVGVDERLAAFRAQHPKARIVTQLVDRDPLTFRAEIYLEDNDSGIPNAVGHADVEGGSGNRKQSPVEKTETAAVGRALDVMGFGEAGREEVERAPRKAGAPTLPRTADVDGMQGPPTQVRTAAGAPPVKALRPPAEVDRDIMTALDILGRSEEQLNSYVAEKYGWGKDWTELPPARKEEVLTFLNAKVNEAVADAR